MCAMAYDFAAALLDFFTSGACVVMLVEIGNKHPGTFGSKMHRHSAPDTAVATGNNGDLVLELAGSAIVVVNKDRLRVHLFLGSRLLVLVLRGRGFVFTHGYPPILVSLRRRTRWSAGEFNQSESYSESLGTLGL